MQHCQHDPVVLHDWSQLKTNMKLHDCEAMEIENVEVTIGLESVKKALRKCQETNKRFP